MYFAARDRRTPLMVRALAVFVAAYALSPIDLIPDFIPVIGYLVWAAETRVVTNYAGQGGALIRDEHQLRSRPARST